MPHRVLRPITDRLGTRGLIVVFLAPMLAGMLMMVMAPRLLKADTEASAELNIQPLIGTYASFEVATHVGDFLNALTGRAAAKSAAEASGVGLARVPEALTATSGGGYTGATVTFTAPTAERATAGLKATARVALLQIAQNERTRAQIEFDSAKASMKALGVDSDGGVFDRGTTSLDPGDLATARQQVLLKAAERVEMTHADLLAAQASVRAVNTVLQSAAITTQEVSTQGDEIRVIVTAQLVAFLLALMFVILARRRTARRGSEPGQGAGAPR